MFRSHNYLKSVPFELDEVEHDRRNFQELFWLRQITQMLYNVG